MFGGASPGVGFMVAQTRRGRPWWSGLPAFLCQLVGAGMSLNALVSLFRATRPGGVFERTPKHRIVEAGQEWRDQDYVRVGDPRALIEGALGLAALAMVPVALRVGQPLLAIYAGMFAAGFLGVAALSAVDVLEVITLRNLGRRALGRVQVATPAAVLFAIAAVLVLAAAQMPEPFEDGYGHWLMAANLAATGHLHDPLFGMEDSWLPGYQVLAAAVLRTFGLWQLGALKAMSAVLGLATLACVYALAPSARQSRLAVAMLLLNPVFLFTSGSAVVEPLLTALLTAAALAAGWGPAGRRTPSERAAAAMASASAAGASVVAGAALALVFALALGAAVGAAALPAAARVARFGAGQAELSRHLRREARDSPSPGRDGSLAIQARSRRKRLTGRYPRPAIALFRGALTRAAGIPWVGFRNPFLSLTPSAWLSSRPPSFGQCGKCYASAPSVLWPGQKVLSVAKIRSTTSMPCAPTVSTLGKMAIASICGAPGITVIGTTLAS